MKQVDEKHSLKCESQAEYETTEANSLKPRHEHDVEPDIILIQWGRRPNRLPLKLYVPQKLLSC